MFGLPFETIACLTVTFLVQAILLIAWAIKWGDANE